MFNFFTKKNKESDNNKSEGEQISKSIDKNYSILKKIFQDDNTIVIRKIANKNLHKLKGLVIFSDGMINSEFVSETVIEPVLEYSTDNKSKTKNIIDLMYEEIIKASNINRTSNVDDLISAILSGDTVLVIEGCQEGLIIDSKGFSIRKITEPESEKTISGPKEGFIESIIVNISLIRRKINNPNLKFKFQTIGKRTKTKVSLCYLEGIANDKIVKEAEKRLNDINIDGILDSGYIQDMIKDHPLSPFQTTGRTSRPDIVAGKLLEGRVAVVCDGSPIVLTLPFLFLEYFHSNEDYYINYIFGSINRLARFLSFFLTISTPAVYVALVTFHHEMIPDKLLISIMASRQGTPFPTIVEILLMVIVFEILREAGVRLPMAVGQAVSIVGALVLGQSAVEAKLVSAPIVIVVALTGISSFLVFQMMAGVIVTRLILLLAAAYIGLYGYIFGIIGLFIYLMSLKSFGVPYMLSLGAISKYELKDTLLRTNWMFMNLRPRFINKDIKRQKRI